MKFIAIALTILFTFSPINAPAQPAIVYDDANDLLTSPRVHELLEKFQTSIASKNETVIKDFFKAYGEKGLEIVLNMNPEVVERFNLEEQYTISNKDVHFTNLFYSFFSGTLEEDKQSIARDRRSAAGRFIVNSPFFYQGKKYYFVSVECGYQLKYDKEYIPRFYRMQCRASGQDPNEQQAIEEDD